MEMEFLACQKCRGAIPVSWVNQAPEFVWNKETGEVLEVGKDDFEEFIKTYHGHRLERLTVVDGPWSRQPYIEPVREDFFHIRDKNKNKLALRRWRNSIDEPFQYEIPEKRIDVKIIDIQIQEQEIEKQLLAENPFPAEWTVEGFILILRTLIQEERRFLEDALLCPAGWQDIVITVSEHPLISFLEIPPYLVNRIFFNIERVIHPMDRSFLHDFVKHHNDGKDVMVLKVVWDFE